MRTYPGDYVVWSHLELGLFFNELAEHPNPHYYDLGEAQASNDELLSFFNKENTDYIYYMEYYGLPGYEVVVLIIKADDGNYDSLKNQLKSKNFARRKERFFFDNDERVIINVGSIENHGHQKSDEICKIISERLPELEKV